MTINNIFEINYDELFSNEYHFNLNDLDIKFLTQLNY